MLEINCGVTWAVLSALWFACDGGSPRKPGQAKLLATVSLLSWAIRRQLSAASAWVPYSPQKTFSSSHLATGNRLRLPIECPKARLLQFQSVLRGNVPAGGFLCLPIEWRLSWVELGWVEEVELVAPPTTIQKINKQENPQKSSYHPVPTIKYPVLLKVFVYFSLRLQYIFLIEMKLVMWLVWCSGHKSLYLYRYFSLKFRALDFIVSFSSLDSKSW